MKSSIVILIFGLLCSLSSCAKCSLCLVDGVEKNVCTNSVLDGAKAKQNCIKAGGEWLKIERQ